MPFPVTALYAAIFAVMVLVLANIVTVHRARTGVSILHGDDMRLALWMRRHGNLIENIPLALVLMLQSEARGLSPAWLHVMGGMLVVGRIAHVVGLDAVNPSAPLRIAGGVLTQLALVGAAVHIVRSLV